MKLLMSYKKKKNKLQLSAQELKADLNNFSSSMRIQCKFYCLKSAKHLINISIHIYQAPTWNQRRLEQLFHAINEKLIHDVGIKAKPIQKRCKWALKQLES